MLFVSQPVTRLTAGAANFAEIGFAFRISGTWLVVGMGLTQRTSADDAAVDPADRVSPLGERAGRVVCCGPVLDRRRWERP
jgi:hypothetical protein